MACLECSRTNMVLPIVLLSRILINSSSYASICAHLATNSRFDPTDSILQNHENLFIISASGERPPLALGGIGSILYQV